MLKKLFKKAFCQHKYLAYSYHIEQTAPGHFKRVTIWKCSKCGKEHKN